METGDGSIKWAVDESKIAPNTMYVLSLSYGKDSIACIEACKRLRLPLDAIIHAEVWATDDIPADLPPMVEFKKKADKIIKERYGFDVIHTCAMRKVKEPLCNLSREREQSYDDVVCRLRKLTYEQVFYSQYNRSSKGLKFKCKNRMYGFPFLHRPWCNSRLKASALRKSNIREAVLSHTNGTKTAFFEKPQNDWKQINIVRYLGIAADEPKRIERHQKNGFVLPLVEIGWDEAYCRKWCEENDLLSPIYSGIAKRGGCWFCHNQGVDELRLLRKNYPDLWALLLKWDNDSPVSFKSDGKTVHDYDKRFQLEDDGFIPRGKKFMWSDLDDSQMNIFQLNSNNK